MNARIACGKCCGLVTVAGLVFSALGSNAFAQGWGGVTPVVVSQGYVTAAVPYTPYGSYGGAGPTTIYRPVTAYPSNYGTCPGGNCAVAPVYKMSPVYGANSSACPNGQCYVKSACPNGQCYRAMPGSAVYPANYYGYPASGVSRGTISNPVYHTIPRGITIPSNSPVYYSPGSVIPATTYPIGGSTPGVPNSPLLPAAEPVSNFDSPFYP